jgi:valyl-tRNA synthetase
MDDGCSRAVREVFVTLYNEGLIYRGQKLINWCPRCRTALSDLEAEHEEINGMLYHIAYPGPQPGRFLTVATTRPETMLGDTALAVHPEDERYAAWAGSEVLLPLMERPIPVIADAYVDRTFGTGALKITPAHDPNDFEIGLRFGMEPIKVIGDDGRMTAAAGRYAGLDRFEARARIVADLEARGLLVKTEPHRHAVGHCYRCKCVVEPNLSLQWFVSVKPLAEPAIAAVESGAARIIPAGWEKTYFEWMRNIRDWCISRQIWWGHRIPAWFCDACGEITVAREDPDACAHCGSDRVRQESDVLDTWFSSALWPFSTLGWPDHTRELAAFYPTACLVTGFDILFFWVARMLMMGLKFMGDVPFRDVYIHALVRDEHGQKMSKSKGNVIDPLAVIEQFGADSFRFTLTAMAAQGRDISLSEKRIEGYRHFVNKIWNASRFVLMNLEGYAPGFPDRGRLDLQDRWIMSRLGSVIRSVDAGIDEYRFNDVAHHLYQFVWHEFCDWFLEMAKPRLYDAAGSEQRLATQQVMLHVLRTVLELLHPIMPFVTEEIWQKLPDAGESIVIAQFPEADPAHDDTSAEQDMGRIIDMVSAVRTMRGEMNVAPSARPHVDVVCHDAAVEAIIDHYGELIRTLAGLDGIAAHRRLARPEAAATAVVDKAELFLNLEGIIDFDDERRRLNKEIERVQKDLDFIGGKLANAGFVNRAPADIVEKERQKHAALLEKKVHLEKNLHAITRLCA